MNPCLSEDEVAELLEGVLDRPRFLNAEKHISECESCMQLVADAGEALARHEKRDDASNVRALLRGSLVGRYQILGQLGAGGAGRVYAAHDPVLDRKIALKLLHRGTANAKQEARLLREGKTMARLSHPGVITIHDVGYHGNQLFIAMELVDGGTLRQWLKAERRSWREIVTVYLHAARGLACAHAAGVTHRDFKPDNVLIGKDGRVRVTDFGLALSPQTTDAVSTTPFPDPSTMDTAITRSGTVLGTPAYMAPEQLVSSKIDARSDQFSFAVALFEALYGERPFDGAALRALSVDPRSREVTVVRARQVPAWVRRILVHALSPIPDERFPSMDAVVAALEKDPALRRQRWVVGGLALAVAAAALGLIEVRSRRPPLCPSATPQLAGVWDGTVKDAVRDAFRDTHAPFADDARDGVGHALDRYTASWVAMHDETCAATRIRGDQSSELMDLRMECLDRDLAGVRALTAQLAHADAKVVERAVQAANALEPLRACADKAALRSPTPLPDEASVRAQIETLRGTLAGAHAIGAASKPVDALAMAKGAAAAAQALHYAPLEAEALDTEGTLQVLNSDYKGGVSTLEEAVLAAEAGNHTAMETRAWIDLTHADAKDSRNAEGRAAAKHAHARIVGEGGNEEQLATLLTYEGEVAYNEGALDEAIDLQKRALAIRERILAPDHPDLAESLDRLGNAVREKGDFDAALAYARRSLGIREKVFGPAHPSIARSLGNVATALSELARYDEAIALHRRALAIKIAAFGDDTLSVADSLGNLSLTLGMANRNAEALDAGERSLAIRLRLLGPDHPDLTYSYGGVADADLALDRWDDAIANATHQLALVEKETGASSPDLARPLTQIGQAYLGKGDTQQAVASLERAVTLGEKGDANPERFAATKIYLAMATVANHGDRARARKFAMEARAVYVAAGERGKSDVAEIDAAFP